MSSEKPPPPGFCDEDEDDGLPPQVATEPEMKKKEGTAEEERRARGEKSKVQKTTRGRTGTVEKKPVACHGCGQEGHKVKRCPERDQKEMPMRTRKEKTTKGRGKSQDKVLNKVCKACGEEGHKNVNYAQITAVLTKAMQELEARVTTLEG